MRVHRLELIGVGPFRDRQVIDFEPLNDAGLFLIDGPTGIGKSTIIDAIAYALYGVVSGGSFSDPARIRSSFCGEADPTGVLCEFSVDGRRHSIARVPKGARDPAEPTRKAKSLPARQVLREYAADGTEVRVLTKESEIREHVEALLGMTSDQFRQLVVLPQGQFAELLRMRPKERLEALGSLLGQEFFNLVQQDLRADGDRAAEKQRDAQDEVARTAGLLAGRLSAFLTDEQGEEAADFTQERGTDQERLAQVQDLLASMKVQAEAAETARRKAQTEMDQADRAATAAEQLASLLSTVSQAQQQAQDARSDLHPADADLSDAQLADRIGELNRLAGSLGDHAEWEAKAPKRASTRQAAVQKKASLEETAADLMRQRDELPEQQQRAQAERDRAQAFAARLPAARTEEQRVAEQAAKARELAKLRPAHEASIKALQKAEQAEGKAATTAEQARADWQQLLRTQADQQAAQLAATLVDGQACPVCGSPEHPSPASPAPGAQTVSDERIEQADAHANELADALKAAREQVTDARAAMEQLGQQVNTLAGAVGNLTVEALAETLAETKALVAAAASAEADLPDLEEQVRSLQSRDQQLAQHIQDHATQAVAIQTEISTLDAQAAEREQQIRALIGDAESATALLEEIGERIGALTDLQSALSRLADATAGIPADQRSTTPDQAREQAEELRATHAELVQVHQQHGSQAINLTTAIEESEPLLQAFAGALADRATVVEQTQHARYLADLVTARSPANRPSLQLHSYALQRRFESVLQAATVHIERISAGRFAFVMSEEAAGAGHSGLGINILDSWTGASQDPKALSGGETFYAALSLALGLADVVRDEAGGSALQTLFVDEGFGSLDQDTLYQVLDQLDRLRAGGRTVGVVSHVTEMKEQISDRIEVRRQPDRTSRVVTGPAAQAS